MMLCLYMKYLRGDTNEDDRERLGWIVAKTCTVLGKVYWNKRKTHEHKKSVPPSVSENKVPTLFPGTDIVPEFFRGLRTS